MSYPNEEIEEQYKINDTFCISLLNIFYSNEDRNELEENVWGFEWCGKQLRGLLVVLHVSQ